MTKQIVNRTIKNIREGTKGFIEAFKKAQQKSYIIYFLQNRRCRKLMDFHIQAINKMAATRIAKPRIRILTDGEGILINVFEEQIHE